MNKKMGILTLITFLLCLMPSISFSQSLENYNRLTHHVSVLYYRHTEEITKLTAVIFDAGSSGSRVHLYHFDTNLNLIRIEDILFEFSNETEPGLSAYPNDAAGAAATLIPLLNQAKEKIPEHLIPGTPLILGATAGLRALDGDVSKLIIDKVRSELRRESGMNNQIVNIITGKEEGAYMWGTVNYLMGTMGESFQHTIGIIELGGASLQMAYALPRGKYDGKPLFTSYIKKMKLRDEIYDVYVYSYQNYGGDKFREMIFPPGEADVPNHPCRLREVAAAEDEEEDSKYVKCRKKVRELLKLKQKGSCFDEFEGGHGCTFDLTWDGGMGRGQHQLFATGSFYYVPANVGMIPPGVLNPEVSIKEFEAAAKEACGLTLEDAKAKYKGVKEKYLKNICVDLTYQYAFLTDVLKLHPERKITLGLKIKHRGVKVTVAWTLGIALERMSKMNLMSFI